MILSSLSLSLFLSPSFSLSFFLKNISVYLSLFLFSLTTFTRTSNSVWGLYLGCDIPNTAHRHRVIAVYTVVVGTLSYTWAFSFPAVISLGDSRCCRRYPEFLMDWACACVSPFWIKCLRFWLKQAYSMGGNMNSGNQNINLYDF